MTGAELHALVLSKWGYSFDLQLRRTQGKLFLQVMWRYQEQASFPLSEVEYMAHLEHIAHYLNGWGQAEAVARYIHQTRQRPRLGRAVSIPLDLGDRASEWLLDDL
ncbi:hypothetical protein XM38_031410 [Halomicronema hongdechloris C2206]|uniref:DUF3067 domain-containing protein n=1 Tax=Halomicronema hongdechloris C2206 TaxID=1641165 RepID=A0A1Z3HPU3_9CYAN|nr:DUF3067 family protein [Halomicronema hongdechloris]ASC72187.1 hypothetical protein XM38_031410 [Halomicronema hongdechloris C2206]